ncbi:MAG: hypothetical protein P1U37_10095 [Minwuia sp.]|nr:hypothetical protein [Minwuia sp.]
MNMLAVIVAGFLASMITIFVFLTGIDNISEFFSSNDKIPESFSSINANPIAPNSNNNGWALEDGILSDYLIHPVAGTHFEPCPYIFPMKFATATVGRGCRIGRESYDISPDGNVLAYVSPYYVLNIVNGNRGSHLRYKIEPSSAFHGGSLVNLNWVENRKLQVTRKSGRGNVAYTIENLHFPKNSDGTYKEIAILEFDSLYNLVRIQSKGP